MPSLPLITGESERGVLSCAYAAYGEAPIHATRVCERIVRGRATSASQRESAHFRLSENGRPLAFLMEERLWLASHFYSGITCFCGSVAVTSSCNLPRGYRSNAHDRELPSLYRSVACVSVGETRRTEPIMLYEPVSLFFVVQRIDTPKKHAAKSDVRGAPRMRLVL